MTRKPFGLKGWKENRPKCAETSKYHKVGVTQTEPLTTYAIFGLTLKGPKHMFGPQRKSSFGANVRFQFLKFKPNVHSHSHRGFGWYYVKNQIFLKAYTIR